MSYSFEELQQLISLLHILVYYQQVFFLKKKKNFLENWNKKRKEKEKTYDKDFNDVLTRSARARSFDSSTPKKLSPSLITRRRNFFKKKMDMDKWNEIWKEERKKERNQTICMR